VSRNGRKARPFAAPAADNEEQSEYLGYRTTTDVTKATTDVGLMVLLKERKLSFPIFCGRRR